MDSLQLIPEGRVLSAKLRTEIDHHSAKSLREAIDAALLALRPEELVLDFSDVRFMDSSGIGLILGRVALAERLSAEVRLVGLSPTLRRLATLSGLEKVRHLTIAPRAEEKERV